MLMEHYTNGYKISEASIDDEDFRKYVDMDLIKIQKEINRKEEIKKHLEIVKESMS